MAELNLRQKLIKEAEEQRLWKRGDTIVVAVSGGPDSMALLHLLHSLSEEQQLGVIVAHADHGFRGEESARELEVVKAYADKLGVPCETISLNMPAYIVETRENAQAAARDRRYAFLRDVAARWQAGRIALAHHADDQAETVLMRIIRGSGLTGLGGMRSVRREKNVELIRPLLRMYKSDLLSYCEQHHIPYCTDSSNFKKVYFRNAVRLDILPYLSQYNPQLPQTLQRLSEVAGAEDDWMERQTEEAFAELVRQSSRACSLDCSALQGLHVALQRRLIKLILRYLSQGAELAAFDAIETMRLAASADAPATWQMDAGDGVRCVREYGVMKWIRESGSEAKAKGEPYAHEVLEGERSLTLDTAAGSWSFRFRRASWDETGVKLSSRYEACFDVSQLAFPLVVRNRRPGDRIRLLGLNGSKKVQDMFVDEKIAPSERDGYPLLVDGEGRLLWIPGLRRSSCALAAEGGELLYVEACRE